MKIYYHPSIAVMLCRILWLSWPLAFLSCLEIFKMPPENDSTIITIIGLVTVLCNYKLGRKTMINLIIDGEQFIVHDAFNKKSQIYYRKFIKSPVVFDEISSVVLLNRSFCFNYLDDAKIELDLSLYRDEDRARLIDGLRLFLPHLVIVDTI